MTFHAVMAALTAIFAGIAAWLFRQGGIYNPVEAPKLPVEPRSTPPSAPSTFTENPSAEGRIRPLSFVTPKDAWHSVRVLCDEMRLSYEQKNILCACIYQESRFSNRAVGKNPKSTDWGIVQVNDKWNIGPGKPFPSVQYVLDHPEECVRWMIRIYKTTGALKPWASYTSQAYIQWLPKHSPMWNLASVDSRPVAGDPALS